MKLIENESPKKQRRIIIESPQLVFLFDMMSVFISHATRENEDTILDIPFEEVALELETVLADIIDAIVSRIDGDALFKLIADRKTGSVSAEVASIAKLIEELVKEDRDGTLSMLHSAASMFLTEACKTIMDELIESGEFNNFKRLTIKTRQHVVVLC